MRFVFVMSASIALALGQAPDKTQRAAVPNHPRALIVSLYREAISRHPHDIPRGADMDIFAPYLSKGLLDRIDVARACSSDWDKQNPEPHLKAEMASEYGPFFGDRAPVEPQTFHIKKVTAMKDGSSRVYVQLTQRTFPSDRSWTWRVAAVVVREDDHYVVDDVIYINDSTYDYPEEKPHDPRLSEYLAAGCNGRNWIGSSLPNQPVTLVRSLYQQVVARTPGGIPSGADWKTFAPYISKTLLHRIGEFNACAAEWFRRPHDPRYPEKAPFGVYESGIFSGGDEETGPRTFQITGTQPERDGSIRVNVKLTWWDAPVHKRVDDRREYTSPDKPFIWKVVPILVSENGRYVVDDVIYVHDTARPRDVDWRLSQSLSAGCKGPHWVGYRGESN